MLLLGVLPSFSIDWMDGLGPACLSGLLSHHSPPLYCPVDTLSSIHRGRLCFTLTFLLGALSTLPWPLVWPSQQISQVSE